MKKTLFALVALLSSCAQAQQNPAKIALHTWATGLDGPVFVANAGDSRLFVVNRPGTIKVITDSMQVLPAPFLDITSQVNSDASEQGLLGMAFDPGYATNGFFYVYYIHGSGAGTSRISRFHVSSDPNLADPASEVVLYTVAQPYWNHNGGCLQFGPDGYLYCGFGDGGSGNDPNGNGQNMNVPLAKMIRIDVSQHDSTYAIPADNPFVGAQDTLPEIWASGLRNPWRYSFDRLNGDLWIGDVGQNAWEEVDHWPAANGGGANFGWRCREGFVATPGVSQAGCSSDGPFTDPVAAFNHGSQGWCSVIGGYVYRGTQFPHLYGKYIFTDYCSGDFLTFGANNDVDTLLMTGNSGYSGFGEDMDGELYVTDVDHGTVKKIVDACPMADPVATFDGTALTSTPGNSWQWLLNGVPVPGATGQSFVPQANGTYQVRVNLGSPCILVSAGVVVNTVGVAEHGGFHPAVYPQPAQSRLDLRYEGVKPAYTVMVMDVLGKTLQTLEWRGADALLSIDVSGVAPGSYLLRGSIDGLGVWERTVVVAR
ncbi:MAG: PQQ-dependent sugar dehydrogenase [Bacteroidetes bacterium]|nr:PQQ-dependent sugar dehydrogenase [Bacteroidota bacterium]MBS1943451.1 PQQ-dependent sugar dehydrogenase [Bacteroidota bacterium]